MFRVIGPAEPEFIVDREKAARYGINVADVQDAVETAVGGKAVSQVLQGEQRYDLVVRYRRRIADTTRGHRTTFVCWRLPESASPWPVVQHSGGRRRIQIYREDNSRYIAIKYSVRGRDLGSTVEEAMQQGEHAGQAAARAITLIGPASTKARSAPMRAC